ncbi:hypothetical protein RSSM_05218, partial [Rhodopirellula sallentina SM41]
MWVLGIVSVSTLGSILRADEPKKESLPKDQTAAPEYPLAVAIDGED